MHKARQSCGEIASKQVKNIDVRRSQFGDALQGKKFKPYSLWHFFVTSPYRMNLHHHVNVPCALRRQKRRNGEYSKSISSAVFRGSPATNPRPRAAHPHA